MRRTGNTESYSREKQDPLSHAQTYNWDQSILLTIIGNELKERERINHLLNNFDTEILKWYVHLT